MLLSKLKQNFCFIVSKESRKAWLAYCALSARIGSAFTVKDLCHLDHTSMRGQLWVNLVSWDSIECESLPRYNTGLVLRFLWRKGHKCQSMFLSLWDESKEGLCVVHMANHSCKNSQDNHGPLLSSMSFRRNQELLVKNLYVILRMFRWWFLSSQRMNPPWFGHCGNFDCCFYENVPHTW